MDPQNPDAISPVDPPPYNSVDGDQCNHDEKYELPKLTPVHRVCSRSDRCTNANVWCPPRRVSSRRRPPLAPHGRQPSKLRNEVDIEEGQPAQRTESVYSGLSIPTTQEDDTTQPQFEGKWHPSDIKVFKICIAIILFTLFVVIGSFALMCIYWPKEEVAVDGLRDSPTEKVIVDIDGPVDGPVEIDIEAPRHTMIARATTRGFLIVPTARQTATVEPTPVASTLLAKSGS